MILYQIGDIPVFDAFKGTEDSGVEIGLEQSWRNPEAEFSNTSGRMSFLPRTRALMEPLEVTLSGQVFKSPGFSVEGFINSIKSLGGRRNTPIIAFRGESPDDDPECCDCDDMRVDWLINYGLVLNVEVDTELKSQDNPWVFDTLPLSIELQLDTRWVCLPPLLWEYRKWSGRFVNPQSSFNSQEGIDQLFIHPKKFSQIVPNSYFYRWYTELSLFNPVYWGEKYLEGRQGGVGSNFTDFGVFNTYADPSMWPADPASVYAFTELSNSGTINIAVSKSAGYFVDDTEVQVSTLDLSVLNADLLASGFGGLLHNDIVYTGLVAPYPGFVMRDGVKITTARPKWSYPGTYPGETGRGYNSIHFYGDGSTGQVAFLHDYGV